MSWASASPGGCRLDDVQIAVDDPEPALQHQLAEQRGGQAQAGRPRVQAGPAGPVLVCDQEELVSQHAATPLRHRPDIAWAMPVCAV